MAKVLFFDKRIFKKFLEITSGISVVLSLAVIFIDIPKAWKVPGAAIFLGLLALIDVPPKLRTLDYLKAAPG